MTLLIKSAFVVNPENETTMKKDVLINNGIIFKIADEISYEADDIINAEGFYLAPGFCDIHVHFRDPGYTYKEDIISGGEAAAAGGFTAVACMPNTLPVIDSPDTISYIKEKADLAAVKIYPIASITKNQQGKELCDFAALKAAGAIALSDDGKPVESKLLMFAAMKAANELSLPIISHCEVLKLIRGGIINRGRISKALGVAGMDRKAEEKMIKREIELSKKANVPVHIAHVSTRKGAELIRNAKKKGIKVTAETCPHYFLLTEDKLLSKDADYRMNPPLRTADDVSAITEAVCDGTIDVIVTDHAPHSSEDKVDFLTAPNGVVGLETSFCASYTALVKSGLISIYKLVEMIAINPRKLLNIEGGRICEGEVADIVIFDVNSDVTVDPEKLHSKSKNTAFKGMTFTGKIIYTINNGKIVFNNRK